MLPCFTLLCSYVMRMVSQRASQSHHPLIAARLGFEKQGVHILADYGPLRRWVRVCPYGYVLEFSGGGRMEITNENAGKQQTLAGSAGELSEKGENCSVRGMADDGMAFRDPQISLVSDSHNTTSPGGFLFCCQTKNLVDSAASQAACVNMSSASCICSMLLVATCGNLSTGRRSLPFTCVRRAGCLEAVDISAEHGRVCAWGIPFLAVPTALATLLHTIPPSPQIQMLGDARICGGMRRPRLELGDICPRISFMHVQTMPAVFGAYSVCVCVRASVRVCETVL
ncbi:hypothetical protein K461DRAFT_308638 [Myriangium duriaei CBS 260.36]|uniref:Uncharacterized protein n=1 Tax=Myriangium duriaei CBS 260.36 TaxID=1168546 RepID=A0A9P4IW41_9PEZI|nr:hypothetical protein K461DRAFT_308638 [Myriangium duriaei CBS 260.36]